MNTMIKKCTFLACAVALLSMTITGIAAADNDKAPIMPVDTPLQIIPANAATDRSFTWQTSDGSRGSLQYRVKGSHFKDAGFTTASSVDAYSKENIDQEIQSTRLTELKPNTHYEYRLATDSKITDWQEFKTASRRENQYNVLIFTDSQCTDYLNWGKTVTAALERHPDAAFSIDIGDLVDNGQAHFQWRDWFANAQPLLEAMPFAPSLGNHEAYDLNWKYTTPDAYIALFATPTNGPEGQTRLAYSFDYGDVHFVSLNTDYEEIHTQYPDMMETERDWLTADLAHAKRAGQRLIVLMHRPPWEAADSADVSIEGRTFMPVFDKFHVPLVFDGHVHVYARTEPLTQKGISSQGTVYITAGRAGDDVVTTGDGHRFDREFYNPANTPMYLTLAVEPKAFLVTAYSIDGTVIDKTVIPTK